MPRVILVRRFQLFLPLLVGRTLYCTIIAPPPRAILLFVVVVVVVVVTLFLVFSLFPVPDMGWHGIMVLWYTKYMV